MIADYRCTLYLPKGIVVIDNTGMVEVTTGDTKLTSDEFSVAAGIAQLLSRLRNGKVVEFNLQTDSFFDANQIIKAEWLKSGNLKNRGITDRLYNFCKTQEEVMVSRGVFTCKQELFTTLPKKRMADEAHEKWIDGLKSKAVVPDA